MTARARPTLAATNRALVNRGTHGVHRSLVIASFDTRKELAARNTISVAKTPAFASDARISAW
jgi:hypothetical protein